mgnify:CR=1 FL=1
MLGLVGLSVWCYNDNTVEKISGSAHVLSGVLERMSSARAVSGVGNNQPTHRHVPYCQPCCLAPKATSCPEQEDQKEAEHRVPQDRPCMVALGVALFDDEAWIRGLEGLEC